MEFCDNAMCPLILFGVDNTNSNIGASALIKFAKPLVMQLHRDSNIPYADTQDQVKECKLYTGLIKSLKTN